MMRIALLVTGLIAAAGLTAMLWQHEHYLNLRRVAVQDRQEMLYGGETFHVLTFLKVHSGADVVAAVRDFRKATMGDGGGRWIYAGKAVINVPSTRIGPVEWSAVTLVAYPSREAYERFAKSTAYGAALSAFERSYAQGARRSVVENLMLPQALLLRKVAAMIGRQPSEYPFKPMAAGTLPERAYEVMARLRAESELGREAAVVVNLQEKGDERMRAADASYTSAMTRLMAELGYGPMHLARAETLADGIPFDRVAIVYYPGTEFFADMLGSTFYQRILPNKQLADNQSTITVPILDALTRAF
jgi:uncharacterized protein (DUF1330 family)